MTTLAKIEANRRNSQLSTGPRTRAGKAVVATNAIRHGIFAHLAVVPGENPYDWDDHCTGILTALAPAGHLEVNFAERAALLLWQIARLGRYQAAAITAGIEDAGLPPPDADPFVVAMFPPGQLDDEHLKLIEQNLRMARRNHAEVLAVADLLRRLDDLPVRESVRADLAESLLAGAYAAVADYALRKFEPQHFTERTFLERIGIADTPFKQVVWTPELLVRGIDHYADAVKGAAAEFRAEVQTMLDNRAAAIRRTVKTLEAERAGVTRRLENFRARSADSALLMPEYLAERVMKYERHLQSLLTSTLHELELLQDRRGRRR